MNRVPMATVLIMPWWVLGSLARRPILWFWLGLGVLLWPLLSNFAAVGVTTGEATAIAAVYEIAFISLQLGALLGLSLLDSHRALFLRITPWRRSTAQVLGISTSCLAFALAGLWLPLCLGWLHGEPGQFRLPILLLLGSMHLALISCCLLHLPLGPWARRILLPFTTWLMPALINPEAALAPWIRRVFGLPGQLLPDGTLTSGQVAYDSDPLAAGLTLLGWALLAWATAPSHPREHAIRDPR